ncbi:MAG TPA: HAD-IIIA family hydrolase [Polyangiaceae bacterium]|jgi:D-glycero-D-manno-heptose 1,7-bisphosphate phosphatase
MGPLAILDRDGTIIDVVRDEETGAITVAFHPSQLRLLSGAVKGMLALQDAGFTLAIATNQPAPAKGQFSADAVRRTNAALVETLAAQGVRIAEVEVCMHHPDGGQGGDPALVVACECRKPKPGMLNALVTRLGADRERSWMIGDSTGDVEAGRAAGLKTALVFATNRCELCPLRTGPAGPGVGVAAGSLPDVHGPNLAEVAKGILLHGP